MKVILGTSKLKRHYRYPVVTLGNFDGVHIGHRHIFENILKIAKKNDGTSILYTFDPHPVKILAPKLAPPLIQTREQKISTISSLNIDLTIIESFTKKFAKQSADHFFEKILVEKLGAKEIVIGYDFTFGSHRLGTVDHLKELSKKAGIKFHIVDAVFKGESLVSSTHIRHYIERGELESANLMLGRPYSVEGTVMKGRGIGAKLGFHTANLKTANELILPPGVYISKTFIKESGKQHKSVTNIGFNPTFGGSELSVETHILDFNKTLVRSHLEISLYKKIRREMTFESTDALRKQIEADIEETRKYYAKRV